MAPAAEEETAGEAAQREAEYEQRRKEHQAEEDRRAEERRQQFEREQQEEEAAHELRDQLRKQREATFERILENAPDIFTAAQLRVLLRAIVHLNPYTFADDLAVEVNGDDENDQRSAEEVLLSTIDNTADNKLTRFALSGHVGIPRENEFDFLTEAETVFAPPQPKKSSKAKKPTPIKAATASFTPKPKKAAAKKQIAA